MQAVDIPKEQIRRSGPANAKYPWASLGIDECFDVPGGDFRAIQSGCSMANARLGRRFQARRTDTGVRVWRIA